MKRRGHQMNSGRSEDTVKARKRELTPAGKSAGKMAGKPENSAAH